MATIHIARNQQNLGAFIEAEIQEGIRTGRFAPEDLVWREGMETWKPLGEMAPQWGMEAAPPPVELLTDDNPAEAIVTEGAEPAWEQREKLGIFVAMMGTINAVLLRPKETFSRMSHQGGLTHPLLFTVILNTTLHTFFTLMPLISLIMLTPQEFQAAWKLLQETMQQNQEMMQQLIPGLMPMAFPSLSKSFLEYFLAGSILLWPLLEIIGYFLGAGLIHLSLQMIGGARRPFETTFRTTCYLCGSFNAAAIVLSIIPGGTVGSMIALIALLGYLIWYSYAGVIAFMEAQEIGVGRVIAAVSLASVAASCLIMIVMFLISPMLLSLMGMSVKIPTP